jgi:hypothetical protein
MKKCLFCDLPMDPTWKYLACAICDHVLHSDDSLREMFSILAERIGKLAERIEKLEAK